VTSAAIGALAAIWAGLLQVEGVPAAVAWPLAAVLPIGCSLLSRRNPAFAPPLLREDGLVLVVVIGLGVAGAPGVLEGWRSALALNLVDKTAAAGAGTAIPVWTVCLVAASMMGGGMYAWWRRG
jgi:hypothetical protein